MSAYEDHFRRPLSRPHWKSLTWNKLYRTLSQCSTVQYSTVAVSTPLCRIHGLASFFNEDFYPLLCCTVLYCTVLYCTVLYCTVLCCTVLYCTVLYCTVLYCTVQMYLKLDIKQTCTHTHTHTPRQRQAQMQIGLRRQSDDNSRSAVYTDRLTCIHMYMYTYKYTYLRTDRHRISHLLHVICLQEQ